MSKIKDLERQIGTIDLKRFMKQYYGIAHDDIKYMTHNTVTDFFPQLKRTSFEHVEKNPDLVRQGSILLVRDSVNNAVPYIVPEIQATVEETQCDVEILIENVILSLQIMSEMSENAIILIEGNDSLDEFVNKKKAKHNTDDLIHILLDIAQSDGTDGVVITVDGNVEEIQLKDCSLEDISIQTDSIAIVLESDKSISFIKGGITQNDYDFLELRLGLYHHLDLIELEFEEEDDLPPLPSKSEIKKLSNYQLTVLMKTYKSNKQFNYYHIMRKELMKRKKENQKKSKPKVKQKIKYFREEE